MDPSGLSDPDGRFDHKSLSVIAFCSNCFVKRHNDCPFDKMTNFLD